MQAGEAMTILIGLGDEVIKEQGILIIGTTPRVTSDDLTDDFELENIRVATAVCTAMLNTALVVAKYRAFVRIEAGHPEGENGAEFTICGASIHDIRTSLRLYSTTKRDIYVTIFQQKAAGAEMVTGYQGPTKSLSSRYDKWLKDLSEPKEEEV